MLQLLGSLIGAAGGVAGAAVSANATEKAQAAANAANIQMNTANNEANSAESQKNRDFQSAMSNSAHQREVWDLQAAGLNPILSANNGASTPAGGTIANQAGHVEPVVSDYGKTLTNLGGSALTVMNSIKDLGQKDAQIGATQAAALSSIAHANQANASAKATEAQMEGHINRSRSSGAQADADIAVSRTRKSQAEIDKQMQFYDNASSRVFKAIGGASDAVGIGRFMQLLKNGRRNQTIKEERHLRNQGISGTSLD